jgi:phosphoribosyl 1,2-cyclic phosphodiesterase
MKIDILHSGSKGNCVSLRSSNTTILIDAGVAKTQIEKSLMNVGIKPGDVRAIFITHAHGDHVRGLPMAKKYNIPVFAGEKEWKKIKGVPEHLQRTIHTNENIGDLWILAFNTHHDSFDPKGYAVMHEEEKVSICLDTGHIDDLMLAAMKGSNTYIIEANHDLDLLADSSYPNSVKVRIASHIGHLSNEQTAEALAKLVTGTGEQIYLVHLSDKNNWPGLAEMTVKARLFKERLKENLHYKIEVC